MSDPDASARNEQLLQSPGIGYVDVDYEPAPVVIRSAATAGAPCSLCNPGPPGLAGRRKLAPQDESIGSLKEAGLDEGPGEGYVDWPRMGQRRLSPGGRSPSYQLLVPARISAYEVSGSNPLARTTTRTRPAGTLQNQ